MLSLSSRSHFADGVELHDVTDTDILKFFLNEEEMAKSSPDSSSQSSPEPEFDSPPCSPPSLHLQLMKGRENNDTIAPFWSIPIKEEPKDLPQAGSFSTMDFPSSLDLTSSGLDYDLKKRKNTGKPPFALSRDDLLKLSSKSLETYAQSLAASRPLTEDEERQLKRQRRLIKNRESAQLSRQRKRLYIEELEKKVAGLNSDNGDLAKQVSLLSTENQSLKDELLKLQTLLKQNTENTSKKTCDTIAQTEIPIKKESVNSDSDTTTQEVMSLSDANTTDDGEDSTDLLDSAPFEHLLANPDELKKILSFNSKKKSTSNKKRKCKEEDLSTEDLTKEVNYIFCSSAQEIKTNSAEKRTTRNAQKQQQQQQQQQQQVSVVPPSPNPLVSFLLPSTSIQTWMNTYNQSKSKNSSSLNLPSLVELSCQVVDVKTHTIPTKRESDSAQNA